MTERVTSPKIRKIKLMLKLKHRRGEKVKNGALQRVGCEKKFGLWFEERC